MASIEDSADYHFWEANRLDSQGRFSEAIEHLNLALEIEPKHIEAHIAAGDIYALKGDSVKLEQRQSYRLALHHYSRALAREPFHGDAWGGKALVLLYMGKPGAALIAAEKGLFALPLCIGFGMTFSDKHTNVAETLFRFKVCALVDMGRMEDARRALSAGFEYCPGSSYLTALIEDVVALSPGE